MAQKESQPFSGILKRIILWLVFAVLITGILIPFYSVLWSDHTLTEVRQECEMVADALLKGITLSLHWNSEFQALSKQQQHFKSEAAAWAFEYGGIDEEDLALINSQSYVPDAVSLLINGEYKTLTGELSREEFDSVCDSAARIKEEAYEKAMTRFREYTPAEDESQETDGASEGISDALRDQTIMVEGEGDIQYLYSYLPLADEVYVVSRYPSGISFLENHDADTKTVSYLLRSVLSGMDTNAAVTSASDHTVLTAYGEGAPSEGDILEEPDERGEMTINGTSYIVSTARNSDYCVYVMVPKSRISSELILSPVFPAVMFALVFLLTIIYAWFLRSDILRGRVEAESSKDSGQRLVYILVRRVRVMFLLLTAIFIILIVIISSLYVVDNSRVRGNKILSEIEHFLSESQNDAEAMATASSFDEYDMAAVIDLLLEGRPERMDFEALSKLAWLVDREIYYLDKDGKVEAASNTTFDFSAMFDPDSDLAPLLKVLKGQANRIEAGEWKDGEYKSYLAVMRTGSGGIILLERTSEAPFAGEEYYAEYKIPDEYTLFSVDSGTGKILTSSEKRYTGETASSIGLTEDVCKDGFVGDIMLDGRRFLVQAMEVGARVDLIASDLSCLLRQFLPLFLETIAVGVVLALLALYFVWRIQEKTWTCLEKEKGKDEEKLPDEENASFYREQDGNLRSYRGAVGRWLHIATPFRMMSADEKFQVVIHIILSAAIVVVYLFYLKSDTAGIRDNTIAYLMQRTWHFGLNIYAVSYALLMIAIIIVLSLLFRRIIIMMGKYFGNRGETIARLIGSFIRYGAVIFSVLYGLLVLGVNTMTILASAGIIGLGVSLGARDLISDILAGISIVFEGEFRTGDIVEIDGFRGIVEEIGVRTTKVMSLENVKVFRNSNVSGVINLTQRHSIAQVRLEISRKEPIGHVKEVITKELPKIRERIPQAVGEIKLMGIDKLTINTVVLLFETRCKEQDRWTVESMLMWELDVLMEKESGGCV